MSEETTSPQPLPWPVLDRYLAGESTASERHAVEALIAADPRAGAALDVLRAELEHERAPTHRDIDVALAQLHARRPDLQLHEERLARGTRGRPSMGVRVGDRWMIGGAALLGVLAVVVATQRMTPSRGVASRLYHTTIGQRATLTLADGSRIVLGPQSQLRVSAGFGKAARLLDLQGEAYFDVGTVAGAPFIVRTGAVTTRVLGTTFAVRRYADDSITRVIVTSGKVVTGTPTSSTTLVAGAIGTITDSTIAVRTDPDVTRYTEWTQGRIVFEQMPVPVLLTTLSRWYGYEFKIADSALIHRRVTGEFRSDALSETLAGLKNVLGVTMTFEGKTVTLRPLPSGPAMPRQREKEYQFPHSTEVGR